MKLTLVIACAVILAPTLGAAKARKPAHAQAAATAPMPPRKAIQCTADERRQVESGELYRTCL